MNSKAFINYPHDTTPNLFSENIEDLITFLEKSSRDPNKWFNDNLMKIPISAYHSLGLARK